jgi:hypothetical protein
MVYFDTSGNKQHMRLSLFTLSILATTPLTFLHVPGETYLTYYPPISTKVVSSSRDKLL